MTDIAPGLLSLTVEQLFADEKTVSDFGFLVDEWFS